jgi:tetratricopeptide (TPR) repeat protein
MKPNLGIKTGLFCFLFLTSLQIVSAQDANGYYQKGETLYGQKQYSQAIDNFSKAISLNPGFADAFVYRGLAYYNNKQLNPAIQDYTKAIELNPGYIIAYFNRGLAYTANNNIDLAIQDYTKTIELSPAYTAAYTSRAGAYFTNKRYDLAIKDYTKAISLAPNDSYSYNSRALAYATLEKYEEAIADYTKAIALAPGDPYAYNGRGNAYAAKKLEEMAIQDYNKSISLNPNDAYSYLIRANVYYTKQAYDQAFSDYTQVVKLNPNDAYGYCGLGNVALARSQNDQAVADYTKAIGILPGYESAYVNRGIANDSRKEYDMAIQDYSKAISLNPAYIFIYNNRGLTYKTKGEYALAISDFEKAISQDPASASAYINIIEPLARLNRFADAAAWYKQLKAKSLSAYVDDPSWNFLKKYIEVVTQDLIANDYINGLKNLKEAENLYSSKLEKKSDYQKNSFSSILALKGFILEKLNKPDEAKQAYDQALLINNLQPEVTAALQKITKKQEILVKTDATPPVITILEPAAKRSITVEDDKPASSTQRIRGQAFDPSGIKNITVNNQSLKIEENGYFETTVPVKEGTNIFTVVAIDNNANSTSQNVVIEGAKAGSKPVPADPNANSLDIPALNNTTVYHGLLIAETDYNDTGIKDLAGTVSDMRKVYNLLVNNYNFSTANTDTLVNATKVNILETLIQKANTMKDNESLFIFYAGHGQMIKHEDDSEEGFLVPVDASKNKTSSYISSDDLVRAIKYSKAKHILFVADACFAGSLFRDISSDAPESVAEAYKDRSRKLLASGNRQAVPDQSEFIEYLRLALQENHQKYITAEQLIDSFKNQYKNTTHLQLQYYPIKNVDDLGGQFVFTRK